MSTYILYKGDKVHTVKAAVTRSVADPKSMVLCWADVHTNQIVHIEGDVAPDLVVGAEFAYNSVRELR